MYTDHNTLSQVTTMATKTLRIGLIAGDGIGREVIPAGRRLLEALPTSLGLNFSFVDLDAGFETFQKTDIHDFARDGDGGLI